MRELEEYDCMDMLKTAGVKIKVMNQLLDRLIPSDDSHTVIVENKTYSIEVIPGNLMTFRVPVKNAHPPMRFFITYNNNLSKSAREGSQQASRRPLNQQLKVYVDLEEKEPRENRCRQSFVSPEVFYVHPHVKNASSFDNQNIYVSFASPTSISISVRVKSTDPKGHRKKKEEQQITIAEDYFNDPNRDPFYPIVK